MAAFYTDTTATSAYVMFVATATAANYAVVSIRKQEPLVAKDGRRFYDKVALKQHENWLREKKLRRERLKDLHHDPLLKRKALPPTPNFQSERQRQKQKRRARIQEELVGC